MKRYILGRVIGAIICIIVLSVIVFLLSRLLGDPLDLILDIYATEDDKALLAQRLGLDKSLIEQYGIFMYRMIRGDLGVSIVNRQPVNALLAERALATLQLGVVAFAICLAVALPVGVYSAMRRGSFLDALFRVIAVGGQSVPPFWLGLMLIFLFSVILHILPSGGKSGFLSLILPAVTLGWNAAAGIMRITRTSMLQVLQTDYIRLARIKGVSERAVIWKHGFKNAMLAVITFSALLFVTMLGGAVVTETVFAWPGLGQLIIQSVLWKDYPVIQGTVLLLSVMYIFTNLLVDISYAYLNPKIRYGGG